MIAAFPLATSLSRGTGWQQPATEPPPLVSMSGNLVEKTFAVYPPDLYPKSQKGEVIIEAVIGIDGTVNDLKATSGSVEFQREALRTVALWTYKPYLLNGRPTEVRTIIRVLFDPSRMTGSPDTGDDLVVGLDSGPRTLKFAGAPHVLKGQVLLSPFEAEKLLLTKVPPVYPEKAKKAGVVGTVIVEFVVDTSGTVVNPKAIHGTPMFYSAAVDAVRRWTYKPYVLNGKPQEVSTSAFVSFR